MSVAYKEKVKIPPQALEQLIVASNHDIRQVKGRQEEGVVEGGVVWVVREEGYGLQ